MRADISVGSLQVNDHFECGEELFQLSGISYKQIERDKWKKRTVNVM